MILYLNKLILKKEDIFMKISSEYMAAGILGTLAVGGVTISYGVNKAVSKATELCLNGYNTMQTEETKKLQPRTITMLSKGAGYISFTATILAGLFVGLYATALCVDSLFRNIDFFIPKMQPGYGRMPPR